MINGIKFLAWIENCFYDQGFKKFTDIQLKTIPTILKHQNLIGISSTGTGKTLAFLIPILQNLTLNETLQSIIISPTRELATQIFQQIQKFKKYNQALKPLLITGGVDIKKQINQIKTVKPQIIVATITRFKELLKENHINKSAINSIVLDEVDMIIDLGFIKDIDYILNEIDHEDLQKLAWSATIHELLTQNLKKYFTTAKIIKVGKSIYENNNIKHHLIHANNKQEALTIFTKTINPYLCIIFSNKKQNINEIIEILNKLNIKALPIHGDLNSRDRKNMYKRIKNLETQYVVASDLASRGLDIDGASHIINWDLPDDPEWYIHRVGRCGRGKYQGDAYLFFDGQDEKKLIQLEKKGIDFDHLFIKKNQFIEKPYKLNQPNFSLDESSINEIKKITSQKKTKVKPNYKKKQKSLIKKIKQKSKRKHLEKKIKEQRIKQYKEVNKKTRD